MAHVENIGGTVDEVKAVLVALNPADLIATDLVQRGAIDALRTLIKLGVTQQMTVDVLDSVTVSRGLVAEVAMARGIDLVAED